MQENGILPADGAQSFRIDAGDLSARILSCGASLQDLRLVGHSSPLVISLPDAAYAGDAAAPYAGAVVGPVAGRIANGRAVVAGRSCTFDINAAPNHLHGGTGSFSHRHWVPIVATPETVTLRATMQAGENGYPARTVLYAQYRILPPATLELRVTATCDATSLVNICHHPYFNLDGADVIDGHTLTCAAETYLVADANALPTGEIASVAQTRFDFRAGRNFGSGRYDHSLCLHRERAGPLQLAGTLRAPSGPQMEVWSTQPALHVYDGTGIAGRAASGALLGPRAGIALEAQGWPGAPNNDAFPAVTLMPGDVYVQTTQYRFVPRS